MKTYLLLVLVFSTISTFCNPPLTALAFLNEANKGKAASKTEKVNSKTESTKKLEFDDFPKTSIDEIEPLFLEPGNYTVEKYGKLTKFEIKKRLDLFIANIHSLKRDIQELREKKDDNLQEKRDALRQEVLWVKQALDLLEAVIKPQFQKLKTLSKKAQALTDALIEQTGDSLNQPIFIFPAEVLSYVTPLLTPQTISSETTLNNFNFSIKSDSEDFKLI